MSKLKENILYIVGWLIIFPAILITATFEL